jgi:hypothetical protein
MTTKYLRRDGVAEGGAARRLSDRLRSVGSLLAAWLETSAEYRAAAAIYERLSALSDAELARRGLARATLARDVLPASHAAARQADVELQRRELTRDDLARDVTDAKRRGRRSTT